MRVKTIGTGSMWNEHNSACYLIDDDIMVDFPNGACKYLYREDIVPSSIDYVLLTHFHGDHYFDMPFYILNKAKHNGGNVNIYCSKDGYEKINELGVLAFPNSFNEAVDLLDINYDFDDSFRVKEYGVTKVLMEHGRIKPAYGYVFENDGLGVGFTGDTSLCENVELMAMKCDYLFCDCMLMEGDDKHQGIDNIRYLSLKYPRCNFVVSHLNNETREKLLGLNIGNVIVPNDGDVFEIRK